MTKDEYIKTLNVCGKEVQLGLDDYGQCYFIEWEENGETRSMGLGTYNFNYMSEIYSLFDPVYSSLLGKYLFGKPLTLEEESKLKEYEDLFIKEERSDLE